METPLDELPKETAEQQSTAEISKIPRKHKSKHHHKTRTNEGTAEEHPESAEDEQQGVPSDNSERHENCLKDDDENAVMRGSDEGACEKSKENDAGKQDDESNDTHEPADVQQEERESSDEKEKEVADNCEEEEEERKTRRRKKEKKRKESKRAPSAEPSAEEQSSDSKDHREASQEGKELTDGTAAPLVHAAAAAPHVFHRVFGVDIGKLEVLPGDELPPVLRDALGWLEDHAIPAPEAMFEDNRKGKKVKAMMQLYETTAPSEASLIDGENSIKAVATLLLVFLKSLPFPLIPTKYYFACIRVMCMHAAVSRYRQLKLVVLSLPAVKRHALLRLCLYLRKSCLPPRFLAKLFQNTLLRPASKEQIRSRGLDVATALIEQARFLSDEVEEPVVTGISVPPSPSDYQLRAVALYDYSAPQEYVISFKKDAVFTLTGKTIGGEWFEAYADTASNQSEKAQHDAPNDGGKETARHGIIPISYVQLCKVEESEVPPDTVPTLPEGVEEQLEKSNKKSLGYATMRVPRTSPTKRSVAASQDIGLFAAPDLSAAKASAEARAGDTAPERPKLKKKRRGAREEKGSAGMAQTLGRHGAARRKEARPGEHWADDTFIPPPPLGAASSPTPQETPHTQTDGTGRGDAECGVPPPPLDDVAYPDYIPPPDFIPPPRDSVSPPPAVVPPPANDIAPPQCVDIAPPPAAPAEAAEEQAVSTGKDGMDIAPPPLPPEQTGAAAPPPADVDIAPPPPQPATASTAPGRAEKKREAKLKKRYNIVKELLSTEETYVKQLELFNSEFCEPLKKNPHGLDKADVAAMFSNLGFILQFHKKLLQRMETAELAWTNDSCFAPLLRQAIPSFKLYSHYVNNYGAAMRIYRRGSKNKAFQKFVSQLDYTERLGGLCFESLLILPVQRIPRYVMLIESMLKNTPEDHPDYEPLSACHKEITGIADQLNHEKLKSDRRERYYEAFAALDNFPQTLEENDSRELIKTAPVTVGKEKLTLFVFDDSIALAKQHGLRYTCKRFVLLGNARVLLRPNGCTVATPAAGDKLKIETEKQDVLKALLQQTAASHKDLATETREDGAPSTRDAEAERRREIVVRIAECVGACKDGIKTLMKCYLKPVVKNSQSKVPALGSLEAKQIRSNTDSLLALYRTLCDELDTRLASWDAGQSIADFFLEKKTEFKLFSAYASKHSQQLATIAAACENPEFKKLLRKLQKDGACESGLKEMTELPLKGIADLKRLVKELVLASPCSDDYLDLQLAFKELTTLCDTISRRGTTNKVQEMLGAVPTM